MWARIMKDRFGATNPKALALRFHTQTAGSTLTAQQPDNNVVRVTLQALAAVMGGTQSLHCNGKDEALALPTEASATLALRTQQVILHESGVSSIVDPLAGSYAVESLTNSIEAQATALIAQIDKMGGTLAAIEAGFIQRAIQDSAYQAQQAIDSASAVVVGVNKYQTKDAIKPEVFRIDPVLEQQQIDRVRQVRASRSEGEWTAAIKRVEAAAKNGSNLMPVIIEAVEKRATLGEIANTLRGVFGEFREQ
jgi:methylmalonyl-CoA mutase N-terminal domain/subunit